MSKAKDHAGVRYGRAVGIRPTALRESKQIVWEWQCDCGEVFESVAACFIQRAYSPGCPSCATESRKRTATKHGMYGTKEYKAWCKVKRRVFDPNAVGFSAYSKLGMDEGLAKSFEAFYSEIGEYPTDGQHYSVDRIDNSLGYFKGNLRWASDSQQSRNRSMWSTNTSGVTGVSIRETKPGNFRAVARWCDLTGKEHTKRFSFNKYGEEVSFLLACQYRDDQIRLLNQQGAGYSPNHGK